MLLITRLWVCCWAVLSARVLGENTCNLLPSELGPDWYKVARQVPPGFEDIMEPSFIHMPCAATTVFDEGICGCTNLMSHIFTSYKDKTGNDHRELLQNLEDTDDVIKQRDPADSVIPREPVGSRILNTRTGEMTDCPFRASSRGKAWYLIREPTETWRPMRCSEGTLFEKRACTCVHEAVASREPVKPEDRDLIVLEEGYEETQQTDGNHISKSLGILISDVDFSQRANGDVPSWRRKNDLSVPEDGIHTAPPTSDVRVMELTNGHNSFTRSALNFMNAEASENVNGEITIGRDAISETHRALLKKLRAGPMPFQRQAARMFIDNPEHVNPQKTNRSLIFKPVLDTLPQDGELVQKAVVVTKVNDKNDATSGLVLKPSLPNMEGAELLSEKDEKISEIQGILNILNDKIKKDGVYFSSAECNKRPLPDLGPQYFLLYIYEAGYVPFACHGSRIYDDKLCACVKAPDQSSVDEVNLPKPANCNKRAIPELGPGYFERHLWGHGDVPYACPEGMAFNQPLCACVMTKK